MKFSWSPMSIAHFAAFQRLMGLKVIELEGEYWGELRPLFYRPLVHFQTHRQGSISIPRVALLGGVQYAVDPASRSNSFLGRLAFDNRRGYTLDHLQRNWKRKVRLAAKEMVIRRIDEVAEFKAAAYPAYLSFYHRTRYQVRADRRDPAHFASWAEALFAIPGILILGGYRQGVLGGISLSFLIGDTLIYATFFCDDESLRLHLPDLMLHTVRESAAAAPAIREVMASMYKGGGGLDDFYQRRGAKLIRQRAWLELNPLARVLLQTCLPRQYTQLLGQWPASVEETSPAAPPPFIEKPSS